MRNKVISYKFAGFVVFQNVPLIIIVKFGENNVRANMVLYIEFGGVRGGGNWFSLHFYLFYIKTKKLQEHDLL